MFYKYGDRSTGRVKDLPKSAWPVRGSSRAESQVSWFSVWGFLFSLFYFIHVQLMSHNFLSGGEILVFQEHNHGYKGWHWNHFTFNTNNSNRFSLSFMHTLLHPLACAFLGGRARNVPPAKCMGQLSTRMHGKLLTHREPALDTPSSHPV